MSGNLLLILASGAAGLFAAGWRASSWFATREVARNDAAHSDSRTQLEKVRGDVTRLERDLANLKADLPKEYVLRTEWLRFVDNVGKDVKELSAKFDKLLEMLLREKARP